MMKPPLSLRQSTGRPQRKTKLKGIPRYLFESSHSSSFATLCHILLLVGISSIAKADPLYEETDGYVVLEAENPSTGNVNNNNWALLSDDPLINPFDRSQADEEFYRNDAAHGGSYIQSKVERTAKQSGGQLTYEFTISTAGTYRFVMRGKIMSDTPEGHDAANDIWMRLRGPDGLIYSDNSPDPTWIDPDNELSWWYKSFTVNWERRQAKNPEQQFIQIWHHEANAPNDESLDFTLVPGTYRLQIAPRANRFAVDRLIFLRIPEDTDDALGIPNYNFLNIQGFADSKGKQYRTDALGYPSIEGELQQWHKTTVDLQGPFGEEGTGTNPFADYRMTVTFTHPETNTTVTVPGYFAADGDAANTSATAGNVWRAHFLPDQTGVWTYEMDFVTGSNVAIDPAAISAELVNFDGLTAAFTITSSDKTGKDFRAPEKGKLLYTGEAYPVWQGGGDAFLKAETNVPEVFLAYADFDNTGGAESRTYITHEPEWSSGDPTWDSADNPGTPRGKGIIGAVNYLSSIGVNSQYFLTMNIEGDGEQSHPWPHDWKDLNSNQQGSVPLTFPDDLNTYDVSKLEQWQIVMDHMMTQGLQPQIVLTEQENQSFFEYYANQAKDPAEPEITFADSRKLYYRELVARFGYLNAVTWNIGEENSWETNSSYGAANDHDDRIAFSTYLNDLLPYSDQIVVGNPLSGPGDALFGELLTLGDIPFTGISLQGSFDQSAWGHDKVLDYRNASATNGRQWIVSYDQPQTESESPNIDTWRKNTVWAALTAGAAGVGFFNSEDNGFSTTDGYDRYIDYYETIVRATDFFSTNLLDLTRMNPNDSLVGAGNYCLAWTGLQYVVYLPNGGTTTLDLTGQTETLDVYWFDPRNGGNLQSGSVSQVTGGSVVSLGTPPSASSEDWVVLVKTDSIPTISPPAFTANPFNASNATEGSAYSDSIAGSATDPENDPLTYGKLYGPAWLTIAYDGTLGGTPTSDDVDGNAFLVEVSDGKGGSDIATLNIMVTNVNNAPVFTVDPIITTDGTEGQPYSESIAGSATDPDPDDNLTYSKVSRDSGPGTDWLTITSNGALSGTPSSTEVGNHSWTVQVSDGALATTATLVISVSEITDPTNIFADFAADFPDAGGDGFDGTETPAPGWSYLWNPGGNSDLDPTNGTFNAENFQSLEPNSAEVSNSFWADGIFTNIGNLAFKDFGQGNFRYARIGAADSGWHPGNESYYAIATYTLQNGEAGDIVISGTIHNIDSNGDGVRLDVWANGTLTGITNITSDGSTVDFVGALGNLSAGDTITITLGSNGNTASDASTLQFVIGTNTLPNSTIENFRSQYGLAANGTDDTGDLSGNGLANIAYFLFGLGNPYTYDVPKLIHGTAEDTPGLPTLTPNEDDTFTFSYVSHKTQTAYNYFVMTSNDLINWGNVDLPDTPYRPTSITTTDLDSEYELYHLDFALEPGSRFINVEIHTTGN